MVNEATTLDERNRIQEIETKLENRSMNFKQFLIWMRLDYIYQKFIIRRHDGISIHELHMAFKQMALPLITNLVKKAKLSME